MTEEKDWVKVVEPSRYEMGYNDGARAVFSLIKRFIRPSLYEKLYEAFFGKAS